jgi:hypothetical protein
MLFDYKLREGVVTKSSLVDLPVVIAKPCVLCGLDLAGGVTVARDRIGLLDSSAKIEGRASSSSLYEAVISSSRWSIAAVRLLCR